LDLRNAALRLVGVGWYIALCLVLGTLGGLWLDRKFETGVVLTLVGVTAGLALALFGVYRMLYLVIKEDEKDRKRDKGKT